MYDFSWKVIENSDFCGILNTMDNLHTLVSHSLYTLYFMEQCILLTYYTWVSVLCVQTTQDKGSPLSRSLKTKCPIVLLTSNNVTSRRDKTKVHWTTSWIYWKLRSWTSNRPVQITVDVFCRVVTARTARTELVLNQICSCGGLV